MSDLISRRALLEDMRNTITESSDTLDWINLINKQPIAYDVDKVVKQLKNSYDACDYCKRKDECNECQIGEVIEIVKGGGRDE